MPTSGTATFNPTILTLIEEAFERAGTEMRSGNDVRSARRTIDIMMSEWANRGINLWTLESAAINLVAGTATYNLPATTVDILDFVIRQGSGTGQIDYQIERMGVGGYSAITNKNVQSRPLQVYVQRGLTPSITLWPIPDSNNYSFIYWGLTRIEDAGAATNTMDMPHRFIPALVAGLAYYTAMKKPELADRVQLLQAEYEKQFQLAADEDRDRSSLWIIPHVGSV